MKVKALRDNLCSPTADDDVRQLDELLANVDEADLSELIGAIRAPITKLATAVSKRRKTAEDSQAAIARLAEELEHLKHDNAAFEAVVDRIKKLKTVKVLEANEIASRFFGEHKMFKSKPEALKAILKRQIADKRASDRQSSTSGIF